MGRCFHIQSRDNGVPIYSMFALPCIHRVCIQTCSQPGRLQTMPDSNAIHKTAEAMRCPTPK
jgi:hypothetical protein